MSGAPKARTSPPVGVASPASTLSSVDLPDPLAPSNATRSPGLDAQGHVAQRGDAVGVAEADLVEFEDRHGRPVYTPGAGRSRTGPERSSADCRA